jgi:hypothetical protein
MEDAMFKYVSIFAALVALGLVTAYAQQTQANHAKTPEPLLTKMELPGADFDIVICSIKPGADVDCGQPERADQWRTRVFLVPKGEAFPSPE